MKKLIKSDTTFVKAIKTSLKQALVEVCSDKKLDSKNDWDLEISHPAENQFGDYSSNVALIFASQFNLGSPRKLAEEILAKLNNDSKLKEIIEKMSIAGPGFINFYLKRDVLFGELETIQQSKENYGSSDTGAGETWLIEHTSPNPNKAMHLGHLRNNVTGMAVANISNFLGYKVTLDCVDNNRGIAIAKLMWGYLRFAHKENQNQTDLQYWFDHQDEWLTPEIANIRPDRFMDELYVKASEDFKNAEIEQRVRQMVVDWENEDSAIWALWEKVLSYVYKGQKQTLDRLGSHWDKVWHEHEHYKQGKEVVKKGLQTGTFQKTKDGAILTNLKEFNLSDTIVQKNDGTALYITQDLALTKLKKDTFSPNKMFWVIGPEQSLAMKQVFAVCQQLGIGKIEDFVHLSYGYMSIKGQGKMSSRAGNVIYIDDLLDQAKKGVLLKIDKTKFDQSEIDKIIELVGVGAVKYSILKNGRLVDMAFDLDKSISLQGNSGPYIQYTYARCKSVLAKAKTSNDKLQMTNYKFNQEELELLRWVYRFPEAVNQAGVEYAPHLICNFIYELAQRFNTFYNKHSILMTNDKLQMSKNEEFELSQFRINLTASVAQILKNGLNLLGIATPERM